MGDTVLEIQNVTQRISVDDVEIKKSFGQRLREAATTYTQDIQPDGSVIVTMVIPAALATVAQGGKNG